MLLLLGKKADNGAGSVVAMCGGCEDDDEYPFN